MLIEIWKHIDSENGNNYEVSSFGNIRNKKTGKSRKLIYNNGYLKVDLSEGGKRINYFVHRLVAFAFLDKPKNGNIVNHIDGNKSNNRISNLEWCTYKENTQHSFKTGLQVSLSGEDCLLSILKEQDVVEIKKHLRDGVLSQVNIAKIFGVCKSTIGAINTGKTWKHVNIP